MNKINLTPQDIVCLIFEKKVSIDGNLIVTLEAGAMEVLYYIEDRLLYGKSKPENPVLCSEPTNRNTGNRKQPAN
jgi:hypothetical protein